MAPKCDAERKVASKLLAQLKTGKTLRGKALTAEQKRDYIDQLEKYAETLTLPASKVSILNQVREFRHQSECKEIETAQVQMTAEAQAASHALACAIGAAQKAQTGMKNVVEKSKTQTQRVAEHKASQQTISDNIDRHADQAASSSEQLLNEAVEQRLDDARQDVVDGVVKLFYTAEKEQKRKHEEDMKEVKDDYEKKS